MTEGAGKKKGENSYSCVSSALEKSEETHLINFPSFQSWDITLYLVEAFNFFLIFVGVINGTWDYMLVSNENKQLNIFRSFTTCATKINNLTLLNNLYLVNFLFSLNYPLCKT